MCIIPSSVYYVLLMVQTFNDTIWIRILGMCIVLSGSSSLCTLSFVHEVVFVVMKCVLLIQMDTLNGGGLLEIQSIRCIDFMSRGFESQWLWWRDSNQHEL